MRKRSSTQPRKAAGKARKNRQAAAEELAPPENGVGKNPNAVALGRLGGKKGGPARAAKLSKKRLRAIARKAAEARWHKQR